MTYIRNPGTKRRTYVCSGHSAGVAMMAATVALSTLISALAAAPKPARLFARKYVPLCIDSVAQADFALMLRESSFQTLVEE